MSLMRTMLARVGLTKADAGEKTGNQCSQGDGRSFPGGGLLPGLSPVPVQDYAVERRMVANPTIAMALAVSLAPVKANPWMVEAKDGTPDDRVKFIQDTVLPLRFRLVRHMCRAVIHGHKSFETVWAIKDGMWVVERMKPLLPEMTKVVVDRGTGEFLGVENKGPTGDVVTLDPAHCLHFAYDDECDGPWGRSRLTNVLKVWSAWEDALRQNGSYMQKGAGVILTCVYPVGQTPDRYGQLRDNAEHAERLMDNIGRGKGLAIPMDFAAWAGNVRELALSGMSPKDMLAWQMNFLEARAGVGGEIQSTMQHLERLMARGLLVPERSFQEGTTGTKAEAGVHGDVAMLAAEELNQDIVDVVNRCLVDNILAQNFGEDARGSVYITPPPLSDKAKELANDIVRAVLTDPANIDIMLATLDWDATVDSTGLAKSEEIIDVEAIKEAAKPDPVPPTFQPPQPPKPPENPVDANLSRLSSAVKAAAERGLGIIGKPKGNAKRKAK